MEVTHIGRTITKNAIQPCGWSSTAPPRAKSVHHAGSIVVLRALSKHGSFVCHLRTATRAH